MSPVHYVALSVILFVIGGVGVLVRRNAIVVFMCIELMLNACNLAFVAFARMHGNLAPDPPPGVYALHDAADRPALLPDGTTSGLSVSSALSPRDPGDEPRFVPSDETLQITTETGGREPDPVTPSGRADS